MRLDRINLMEKYIINRRTASLQELSDEFQVSLNTIRRDLNTLSERGNIYKVYGGVAAKENGTLPSISERAQSNHEEKVLIGKLAASLVKDNSIIFLDAGSTTVHIVPHLANRENLTIVTHSLSIMNEAAKYPGLQIVALGGYYNSLTNSYTGGPSILSDIQMQMAFMAGSGISLNGIGSSTYGEYTLKKQVVSGSEKVIFMADHTKFGRPLSFCYASLSSLSAIVTDQFPPEPYIKAMKDNSIQLLCGELYPEI